MEDKPKYLMNSETREIYPYSVDLEKLASPRFLPYVGTLPPPDFRRGVLVAPPDATDVKPGIVEHTPEQRVEILAGVLPIVPPEELTKAGEPALLAMEKLSGLEKVQRKEVNAAMRLRASVLDERHQIASEKKVSEVNPETGEEMPAEV